MKKNAVVTFRMLKVLAIAEALVFSARSLIRLNEVTDFMRDVRWYLKIEDGSNSELFYRAVEAERKLVDLEDSFFLSSYLLGLFAFLPWARTKE